MKICLLGLDNLPVLAPQHATDHIGGAQVQQTLLARALVRAGHDVSMVVRDHGQRDGQCWDGVRTLKAYRAEAGYPVTRFVHPRWTGIWSALRRADADVYYTSCAGMQVGLLAAFCRRFGKRFVFRTASDTDCDPERLLVRYRRDRWLYAYGLRRADAILVQSAAQADTLVRNYGLPSRQVGSLVETVDAASVERDVDMLWVGNIRRLKRPDVMLSLAASMPDARVVMVGGALRGEERLFQDTERQAGALENVEFLGRLTYEDTNAWYARARVLVNTSESEGFPNTFMQGWVRGVPVVSSFDPDGVIEREGLGIVATSFSGLKPAVESLLDDAGAWRRASERCRAFMAREYDEQHMLAPYLEVFHALASSASSDRQFPSGSETRHV